MATTTTEPVPGPPAPTVKAPNPKVTALEMAFRMRSSKFRHVFGSPSKKEMCYECIKITKNAHDSNFCAVNPKFVAIVTESAGGGAFLILPLEKVGRVDINAFKVCGHSGPVLDIAWNPFDDHVIASCSDDATIKLWQVPEDGLTSNLTEWLVDLHGHQRRVGHITWHPTAQNILLSAGYDHKCILWNTETAEPVNIISVHNDTIFSIAWNMDGSLFATTSKDKKIRVIDPRSGDVINEGTGHAGSKSSKVVFVGDKNRLFTTGFSRMSERQCAVWDAKNLSRPLTMETIDASSGVLFPYYDPDTNVVFVAGKGDGNIRYFELVNDHPYCHYLAQYQSSSPQRGLGMIPKRGIDTSKCEIVRFYKLHAVKGVCEPISMIVPRKSEMFQEDIFPPTASACPSLTADEWISGQNRQPILISLKPPDDRTPLGRSLSNNSATNTPSGGNSKSASNKTRTPPSGGRMNKKDATSKKDTKKDGQKKEQIKKDGAISNSPVITTYKAVKRGMPPMTSPVTSSVSKRMTSAPPTATVAPSPGRLPQSIQNIRKMTSVEDADRENQNEEIDTNDNNNSVNDRISSFEKKTGVNVSKSVMRMTNTNQPLRVERKIWSTSYTGVNHNPTSPPATNGMPRTDPEQDLAYEPDQQGTSYVSTPSGITTQSEVPKPATTATTHPAQHNHQQRLSSAALEQAEQELYANLHIDTPHYQQQQPQRRYERKWSRLSDSGSEPFSTPPTSPLSQRSPAREVIIVTSDQSNLTESSPTRSPMNRSLDHSTFIQDSPASWTSNPLYSTSATPTTMTSPVLPTRDSQRNNRQAPRTRSRTSSRDSESSVVSGKIAELEMNRDMPQRRSLRSSVRGQRETEQNNNNVASSNFTRNITNGTRHREENNNVTKIMNTSADNINSEDLGFLELDGCFPSDAPDHTLMKPSKLRASLRGRRRHTNTGTSSDAVNAAREVCASPTPFVRSTRNFMSTQNNTARVDHSTQPSVTVVENKSRSRSSIASCTAQEKIPYPSSTPSSTTQQYSYIYNTTNTTNTTASPPELDESNFMDQLNANTSDALIRPSKMRDSFRRRRNKQISIENGSNNTDHVKSPASPVPSPTSPPPVDRLANTPLTEAELRKAYFRQVEEMSSLKEQIGLKDKRIRQLEEEVRMLRDGRDLVGESTC